MHEPITSLPDGTIKQVSPYNGTQVWTVPGRALRPFVNKDLPTGPIDDSQQGLFCSFCAKRYLDSPPETARLIANDEGGLTCLEHVGAANLCDTEAIFRRVPNLFPILPMSYWRANYGLELTPKAAAWRDEYASSEQGRAHLSAIGFRLAAARGVSKEAWDETTPSEQMRVAETFFGSCHDLIIGHRHFLDEATTTDQLASSGTLSQEEHDAYLGMAIDAAASMIEANPFARYVAIFQNWLRPAGASFDHLHKQIAAIDEISTRHEAELERLKTDPGMYRRFGIDYAQRRDLVIAENDHAVAFAGFGHRYPSIEIHSLDDHARPWELSRAQRRGLSDIIHAVHAASGLETPCNEEWHYQPQSDKGSSPTRVVVKWRISTLAGFEGATKIYLNTMSPWHVRDRAREALASLDLKGVTIS